MRRSCLNSVHELARRDPRVVFIGSDLGAGTLAAMKAEMPERFFMEGVSEQHVIGMAAGMAFDGFVPYVNTIATFITRRCFEQVAIDACLHNLPIRLIGNGGGLVYAPLGPTHLAIEDIAIMRALPNMTVVCPADAEEMSRFMATTLDWPGPIYIRLGKGGDPVVTRADDGFAIGRAYLLREPGAVLFATTGVMTGRCLRAAEMLAGDGIPCGVLHVPTVKPLDTEILLPLAAKVDLLVTVEEHTLVGGLGSAILEAVTDAVGTVPRILRLGIPDVFPSQYGSQDSQLDSFGLQPPQLADAVRTRIRSLKAA